MAFTTYVHIIHSDRTDLFAKASSRCPSPPGFSKCDDQVLVRSNCLSESSGRPQCSLMALVRTRAYETHVHSSFWPARITEGDWFVLLFVGFVLIPEGSSVGQWIDLHIGRNVEDAEVQRLVMICGACPDMEHQS